MNDYLAKARTYCQDVALTSEPGIRITWLTVICEQILNYLEAQQGDNKLPQGEMDERPDPVTDPKLQKLLDQARFGDILSITNGRGKHLCYLSGPVLGDQTHDPCVGIDLLDGEPYIVRDGAGTVWAPISYAAIYRDGGLVAMWVEDAMDLLEEKS